MSGPGQIEATSVDDRILMRPAQRPDADAIVQVFLEAMPEVVTSLNVLGTAKSAAFVRDSIAAAGKDGEAGYWVAVEKERGVVAFVQMRRSFGTAILNHIHVVPDRQARGIGTSLLRFVLGGIEAEELALDVFDESAVALSLYRRLGFAPLQRYHWHILELPAAADHGFLVRNLPQADVTHAAFDLSSLQVETRSGTYEVGRLGDRWFRITSAQALADDDLLPALAALDGTRAVFAIVSADGDPYPGPPVLSSVRLSAPTSVITASLGRSG